MLRLRCCNLQCNGYMQSALGTCSQRTIRLVGCRWVAVQTGWCAVHNHQQQRAQHETVTQLSMRKAQQVCPAMCTTAFCSRTMKGQHNHIISAGTTGEQQKLSSQPHASVLASTARMTRPHHMRRKHIPQPETGQTTSQDGQATARAANRKDLRATATAVHTTQHTLSCA